MTKKSRTREARQRRKKEQNKNQQRMILAGIVVVAVLVIALIIVSNQPTEAYVPPEIGEKFDGLSYSPSLEGYPRIGDPDAPVTVEEYASFSCPGCEAFHSTSFNAILDRVRTGQVLFTYVPLQTGSLFNAQGAARGALCAGQQGMFWEMHDVLFEWHTLYGNTAFSGNRLQAGVSALGMNVDSFNGCFNSQSISNVLEAAQAEGVASTPTIDVNGVTVASEGGGIPTTEDILTAIDNATPNDWTPNSVDTDETETDTLEATEEPDVGVGEATEEPDAEVGEAIEEPATDDESDMPEATEEADE
jgi:protein-disulfide isomerase